MWAVIGDDDGQEHNQFYRDEQDELVEKGERLPGESVFHTIANPLSTSSSATHVCGGALMERPGRSLWNPSTHDEEDYAMDNLLAYVKKMSSTP